MSPKITLAQAIVSKSTQNSVSTGTPNADLDEYEEDIATLSKLMGGSNPPVAQVVHDLLDSTRPKRKDWLLEEIAILEIIEKYPCFKVPKWVGILLCHILFV